MKTKICSKCNIEKDEQEFYKHRNQCKDCINKKNIERYHREKSAINDKRRKEYKDNPEKFREIKRKEYKKNKEKYKKRSKEWRRNNPEKTYKADKKRWKEEQMALSYYLKIKKGGKCEECRYDENLYNLDWHHKNPSEKKFNISKKRITPSNWKEIIEEIEKCSLLCPICHRKKHNQDMSPELSDNTIERFAKYGIDLS